MVDTISRDSDTANISREEKGRIIKQIWMSILAALPFLTHGVETTELSSSAHSGHFKDTSADDDLLRMTVMTVSAAVSAPVYTFIIDKYGRKSGFYFVSLLQGASCVPLFLPPNLTNFILLHIFAGLTSGGLFIVIPAYILEINSLGNRALMISVIAVMTTGGYLIGLVLDDEGMMFLMVAMIAIQFLGITVMTESPSYLVMVGKIEEAKSTLASLICLPVENPTVAKSIENLIKERDRARSDGKLNLIKILKSQLYRDIIKIGIALYTVLVICGSITFLDQEKALVQLKMEHDPGHSTVTVSLFAGSFFTLTIVRFLERKHILTFGLSAMVLSMGILAIFNQRDMTFTSSRWFPVAALAILVFAYGMIWGLPYIVLTEILNLEIRATILGVLYSYSQIIKLAHLHSFDYIEDYMGRDTLLFIFCGINIFGAVYSLFMVPNLRDKCVQEIEKQLSWVPYEC